MSEVAMLFGVITAVTAIVSLLVVIAVLLVRFSKSWREEMKALLADFNSLALTMARFETGYVTLGKCEAFRDKIYMELKK